MLRQPKPMRSKEEAIEELVKLAEAIACDLDPTELEQFTLEDLERIIDSTMFVRRLDEYSVALRRCYACPVPAR